MATVESKIRESNAKDLIHTFARCGSFFVCGCLCSFCNEIVELLMIDYVEVVYLRQFALGDEFLDLFIKLFSG